MADSTSPSLYGLDATQSRIPGSPEWWLLRLGQKLANDSPRFDRLESYWEGNPPLPIGNRRMRDAYKRFQQMSRTNFGALIAEAVLERLKVIGFRAGADATQDDDKQAWKWWQHNHLDADSGLVHRAAVVMSRSYVIVGKDPDTPGMPLVTAEDPRCVTHEASPTNRRKVDAALKTWFDATENTHFAVLYMPDMIYYYRTSSSSSVNNPDTNLWKPESWTPDLSVSETGTATNTLGVVPVVPFTNRPTLTGVNGLGEFEDVIDILDRINTEVLDRVVISAMQAYRQRWAKGIKLTDESGNDTSAFDPGADLLWAVEDSDASFGDFAATDLTPIVKAIESDVQYLSAVTRTPPHYILAGIVNASGDALSVAETGLTSKAGERLNEFSESWESVYKIVGLIMETPIADDAQVLWKDPQFHSLTELAAASVQLQAAGVPWRTRMRLLDMSPQEIDRMEIERVQDAMHAAMMQPLMAPPPGAAGLGTAPGAYVPSGTDPSTPTSSGAVPGPTPGLIAPPGPSSAPSSSGKSAGSSSPGSGVNGDTHGKDRSGTGVDATWGELYARARQAGIRSASKLTKAQLVKAVG